MIPTLESTITVMDPSLIYQMSSFLSKVLVEFIPTLDDKIKLGSAGTKIPINPQQGTNRYVAASVCHFVMQSLFAKATLSYQLNSLTRMH